MIGILALYCLSSSIFKQQDQALAQHSIQTIKYRNLVIDLGNGVKTNAQLTYPVVGKGPFPGVLLIHGSGAYDKSETLRFAHKNGPKPHTPLWQIAQYLSERGFAVLRYDKRGVGANLIFQLRGFIYRLLKQVPIISKSIEAMHTRYLRGVASMALSTTGLFFSLTWIDLL